MATNEIYSPATLAAKFDKPATEIVELLAEAGIEPEEFAGNKYFRDDALKLLESELAPRELLAVSPTELKAVPPERDQ